MSSIRYDTDFVLAKQTTDVIVNGAAHAPRGTALRQLDVSLRVGDIRKNVRVFGNRFWGVGAAWITAPEPFESMPLRFEHAFGGHRPEVRREGGFYWPNPVGTGFATTREHAAILACRTSSSSTHRSDRGTIGQRQPDSASSPATGSRARS
jgi:hypothetical protein